MKMNIFKSAIRAAGALIVPACLALSSCSAEPDDSNLYTFTGETIQDFLHNNDTAFSSFSYILTRAGYDRILSSYGTYTCFAPNNAAVAAYIDSLYNDTENERFPHNGMTDNSLEGLSDSLCLDITLYHLAGTEVLTTNMGASGSLITTLLGRQITTSIVNGKNVLNDVASITMADHEVVNGVVHVVDRVIPRSNRLVANELQKSGKFDIFYEALVKTGLVDSLEGTEKPGPFTAPGEENGYYTPTTCKLGYTVFAEPDELFRNRGINSIDDLIDSAKVWYGASATAPKSSTHGWYDYYRNNNITVSTGDDYNKENNVLNMFVRYHILKYSVSTNVLSLDHSVWKENGYSGDTFDYYETMLPKTLLKTWKVRRQNKTFINRYVENNTLTDGVETMGSDAMHTLRYAGAEVDLSSVLQPLNGFIYPINDILLYNSRVPNGVLNERMRFDALTLMPEVMSNGFRGMHDDELTALNSGKSAARVRFPIDYMDNVKVYNGNNTKIDMNVLAAVGASNSFLLYKGDSFQGMGVYDLAIKMPPVPDGMYELRAAATNFGERGSMLQFYLGTTSDPGTMEAIDIPLDLRISSGGTPESNPRLYSLGWMPINNETDYPDAYADRGLETDKVMRTHGYMRDGLSIVKENQYEIGMNARVAAYQLRKILVKRDFKQQDYWLRIKTVLPEVTTAKYQLDYIELVPVNVYENGRYMEDMY